MKNKQDIVNFNQFLNQHDNDRENDIRVGNGLTHKQQNSLKLNKNITCTEDEKLIQDPAFILLCIKDLQNELKVKEQQYQQSIVYLQDKIYQKENEGKSLNEELHSLRKQMIDMKEQVNGLALTMKAKDCPYQLQEPKRKLKKNKSSQFLLFKTQSRSKSKKQNRR